MDIEAERFLIDEGRLVYDDGGREGWSLDISRIVAIAEYTVAVFAPGE